jgi:CRP-like cAMP-binding protein
MPFDFGLPGWHSNRLLSLLPEAEYEQLQPMLERVSLPSKYLFYERNQPIQYVYFPCSAVGSALALLANGTTVEAGTIGKEGVVGLEVFLGGNKGLVKNICQVPGEAIRIRAQDFRAATRGNTALQRLVQRYSKAYLGLTYQTIACNRFHTVEERCARWLLMTQDRAGSSQFFLTQEFLADMLGVHRPTVTLVVGLFQKAGIISYKRGLIAILDRKALESASCECYGIVQAQFERLLGAEAIREIERMKI